VHKASLTAVREAARRATTQMEEDADEPTDEDEEDLLADLPEARARENEAEEEDDEEDEDDDALMLGEEDALLVPAPLASDSAALKAERDVQCRRARALVHTTCEPVMARIPRACDALESVDMLGLVVRLGGRRAGDWMTLCCSCGNLIVAGNAKVPSRPCGRPVFPTRSSLASPRSRTMASRA